MTQNPGKKLLTDPNRAVELCKLLHLVTESELALALGVSPNTLREWRRQEKGPDYAKIGKSVVYLVPDVEIWLSTLVVPVLSKKVMKDWEG